MDASNQTGSGLGIVAYDHYEFVVADLERSRRFYTRMMDVPETARLAPALEAERGERSVVFQAGKARCVCTTPTERGARADRWLARHPDGVAVVAFRVRDLGLVRRVLAERGATFCSEPFEDRDGGGRPWRSLDIATPLGDVRFRFIERSSGALPPGFMPLETPAPVNRHRFQVIDHVTSNFLTIRPHVTWLREVMGFEEYWRVHFHTGDAAGAGGGSGLASIVMWDPESGIKLANNEPVTPNYEASQIYAFVEANRGPGVQHVAFHVPAIVPAVEGLRREGLEFLDTPATYYDMLPERVARQRVGAVAEPDEALRRLGILLDGGDGRYLLQIFMVEGGVLYDDAQAGPFFYEVIQRCGARGFGEGNFRALFEAIERDQAQRTVAERQLAAGAGS